MLRAEDTAVVWRCDRCASATVVTGSGMGRVLDCVCDDQPHTNFHFQVLTPGGVFPLELWFDPNDLDAPGVRSLP